MKKKGFITGILVGGLIFGSIGVFAGQYVATDNPFPVQLNGNNISIKGYNIEGSTYFKLRDIADKIGGFEVNFENDTILLSNNNYSYSNNNVNNPVTNIRYYSHPNWCPDFGAYTGAEFIKTTSGGNGYLYYANPSQKEQYTKLLLSLGFVKGKIENNTSYVKDLYYFITFVSDETAGMVGFIAGCGDWVSSLFIAD